MEKFRRPLFIVSYIALLLAFGIETGSCAFSSTDRDLTDHTVRKVLKDGFDEDNPLPQRIEEMRRTMARAQEKNEAAPSYGIRHLGLLDGIVLLVMTWMVLSMLLPRALQAIQGRVQGLITLLIALSIVITAIVRATMTFVELIVMVSLFMASPFGFVAYMAIWGFFDVSTATWILGIALFLKLTFIVVLVIAHQQFLKVKSMLLIVGTSLVLTIVTEFLIGWVPDFMASITDAVAGLINAVATVVWGIVLAVMSLMSVYRALRADRGLSSSDGAA